MCHDLVSDSKKLNMKMRLIKIRIAFQDYKDKKNIVTNFYCLVKYISYDMAQLSQTY